MKEIFGNIFYAGTNDIDLELFENQYKLKKGVTYNSYIIKDEKTAVLDSVDSRKTDEWLNNIGEILGKNAPDFLIISHLEPDHSGSLKKFFEKYPQTVAVGNEKTFSMLPQFFENFTLAENSKKTVKEGDVLELGSHSLKFFMAPLVHWPEVMVSYEISEKILFSADAFGTFDVIEDSEKLLAKTHSEAIGWTDEARRYFTNIVGKYGISVQNLLKKLSGTELCAIAPLHGPILTGDFEYYINHYDKWSSYTAEEKGTLIVYSTLHGNTRCAAEFAKSVAEKNGEKTEIFDLSRSDVSEVLARAFKYDKILFAAVTYDGANMPCMEDFLYHLKLKNFAGRKIGIIQNGTWGPVASKYITEYFNAMKNMEFAGPVVTIRSSMTEKNKTEIEELVKNLIK